MAFVNWRTAFLLFAFLGVIWTIIFYLWFRDTPREHRSVNAAELDLMKDNEAQAAGHGNVPWRELVTRPTMWLLWGQYFCLSYGWYFYVTWLPTYLRDERGMDIKSNAVMGWMAGILEGSFSPDLTLKLLAAALAGIPLFFGGFGSLTAGLISNRLINRGHDVSRVRKTFGFCGLAGASALLMTSFYIKDPLLAMLSMGLASFFNDLTMPGSWASCMDIGGKFAGTVSGSMNMMGNFGGMAGPVVVGVVLSLTNRDWHLAFVISAVVYFSGAILWLFIDPVTPLEKKIAR
jgi:MFS family permease